MQISEDCKDTVNGAATSVGTGSITGYEDVVVGTATVRTLVVSWEWHSPSYNGTEQAWVDPRDNLLVQAFANGDAKTGTQTDHQSAQITLQDITPS